MDLLPNSAFTSLEHCCPPFISVKYTNPQNNNRSSQLESNEKNNTKTKWGIYCTRDFLTLQRKQTRVFVHIYMTLCFVVKSLQVYQYTYTCILICIASICFIHICIFVCVFISFVVYYNMNIPGYDK